MNCTYALMESVLMSSVPSDERSRWKSLESVAAFSWTGSAVIGGVLSDAKGKTANLFFEQPPCKTHNGFTILYLGYAFAFAITSVVQMIGTWIILPLDGLVPKEEEPDDDAATTTTNASLGTTTTTTTDAIVDNNSISEPLLSASDSSSRT